MPAVEFSQITDLKRQAVEKDVRQFYENNDPGMRAFGKAVDKPKITEKGYRLPDYARRPTGMTWFTPDNSDFNQANGPQTVSMWVYPTMSAWPMIWTGSAIESMEVDTEDNVQSYDQVMVQYTEVFRKRTNQYFYGTGNGAVAFSASTITALGSQTLSGTTTAATTPGQTKGTMWLWEAETYQAINASTGAVRGTFTVTTPGTTSCTINLLNGTITSGDPIVIQGSYQLAMRGLYWLISDQNRVLQGLDTSVYTDLNVPTVDLAGALLTPAAIENGKALLQTRNNQVEAKNNLTAFITPGQYSTIRKQGYNLGYYLRNEEGSDTMKGVQGDYTDGDTRFILDADNDEDRVPLCKTSDFKIYEMKPYGPYKRDGLDMRMLLGANQTGSDNWQKAVGWKGNPATLSGRGSALIKRAQPAFATQISAGL
jgi:hypothetical protein